MNVLGELIDSIVCICNLFYSKKYYLRQLESTREDKQPYSHTIVFSPLFFFYLS